MHIRLTRTEIAAFDCVVEKPIHTVAIVLVVLCGIDAALSRDAMRTPRAILVAETFHLVTLLSERRCGGSTRQAAANNQDFEPAPVVRGDQLRVKTILAPFLFQRAWRNFTVQ